MYLPLPSEGMYTTWCVKMGQSAILQTPEYLSRAVMRLPMNLRVRWYEHTDGRSDSSNLVEVEKWLCKRVETLFNPLEDFISEGMEQETKVHQIKARFQDQPPNHYHRNLSCHS